MKRFVPFFIFIALVGVFIFSIWKIFPIKYKDLIVEYSVRFDLSPELVSSLINAESGYNDSALSYAGARGLMQVLPSTADEVAGKLNLTDYDLFNPNDNVYIGCYYLKYLLDYYNGDVVFALCGYNAGINNVKYWDFGGDIEKIPVSQTKNYVKKILRHIKIYKLLYY